MLDDGDDRWTDVAPDSVDRRNFDLARGNPLAEPDPASAGLRGLAPSRRLNDEDAGAADEAHDDVDPQEGARASRMTRWGQLWRSTQE